MKPATVLPFPANYLPKSAPAGRRSRVPSPAAVKAQLSKILQSEGFVHAHRMRGFLEFVVEETLAGRAHQLCEYSIGISVFGRDKSFEPGLDPIVRNDARRLRQKLAEYYLQLNDQDDSQVRIDIPKGGYVPAFQTVRPAPTAHRREQYRLSVTLIRMADGAEIWNTEHDFQSGHFGLQLAVNTMPEI